MSEWARVALPFVAVAVGAGLFIDYVVPAINFVFAPLDAMAAAVSSLPPIKELPPASETPPTPAPTSVAAADPYDLETTPPSAGTKRPGTAHASSQPHASGNLP
jgi:hypothetical protein